MTAPAAMAARTLHVEPAMGTTFTIDIRDDGQWQPAVQEVVEWLHFVDATFSTYRADSDVSRIRRGELRVADAHPLVADVLDRCAELHRATGGWFTAQPHGEIDPTGLVKGWAIERASELLSASGARNHGINGGGDMQLVGEAAPGSPWRVGISDPHERTRILATITGRDLAVATSGVAERGAHIVDPFTGRPAAGVSAVSVLGRRLGEVDAYATAAFAMGAGALSWLDGLDGVEGLVVAADGTVGTTRGWRLYAA